MQKKSSFSDLTKYCPTCDFMIYLILCIMKMKIKVFKK